MAHERHVNVQDAFLNHVRKNRVPITIFLVNGVKLQGIVTWFDSNSILLKREGNVQLVYKHAASTLMPHGPVNLFESHHGGGGRSSQTDEEYEEDDEYEDD